MHSPDSYKIEPLGIYPIELPDNVVIDHQSWFCRSCGAELDVPVRATQVGPEMAAVVRHVPICCENPNHITLDL